ncbi:SUKH-4 family immunity protein [Streptomyces sp. NPDC059828]|uniref:SUKH-4 family immunity protein n=1 Tax=Streptomyces sp. NPDC059828 TaxID=3346965 RepID=UPI00364AF263
MNDSTTDNQPHFHLTHLSFEDDASGISLEVPVQTVGGGYRASNYLQRVTIAGHGECIRFGSVGAFGSILLDPVDGRIVESGSGLSEVTLVNSSLDCFTTSVKALINRFPFYSVDSDPDDWERAARDIEDSLRRIDSDAYTEGSFWYELRWSISIGDFATEDLTH